MIKINSKGISQIYLAVVVIVVLVVGVAIGYMAVPTAPAITTTVTSTSITTTTLPTTLTLTSTTTTQAPYVVPTGLQAQIILPINPLNIAQGNLTTAVKAGVIEGAITDKSCRVFYDEKLTTFNIYMVDTSVPNPKAVQVAKMPLVQNSPASGSPQMVLPNILDMAWDHQGNLIIAGRGLPNQNPAKPVGYVWKVDANKLDPNNPGTAYMFGNGSIAANGIAIDKHDNVYLSGNNTIYMVPATGGQAKILQIWVNGTNNIAFNQNGTILWATSTALGAIWKLDIAPDGSITGKSIWITSPKLLGADGIAVDTQGNIWVTSIARNAIVVVTPDKKVIDVIKNDNNGPLEGPTDIHFCNKSIYIGGSDTERAPVDYDKTNLEAGNRPRYPGVGPSISKAFVGIDGLPLPP